MYCKNCGNEIGDLANFCRYCGHRQDVLHSEDNSALSQLPPVPESILPPDLPEENADTKWGYGCLAIFVFFIFAAVMGSQADADKKKDNESPAITPSQKNESHSSALGAPPSTTKQSSTQTASSAPRSAPIQQPKKAIILEGAICSIPTQKGKGFDKTIARYGVKRIKKINSLLPKVAEKAASAPCMDVIWNVDVSDNMSTQNELIFYADAKNGNRLYINEKMEIIDGRKMY